MLTSAAIERSDEHEGGESAIDAISISRAGNPATPDRPPLGAAVAAVAFTALALAALLALPTHAAAGRSATGEAAFLPCNQCHPVSVGADGKPTKQLPIGMEKHTIELEVHDTLGAGSTACLACHDEPTRDPGKLILPDGSLVDITEDASRVCQRCHFEKYRDWEVGIHGRGEEKCSAAGCHDPHTPSWIFVPALPPFQGTGMEVRAVSEREPFKPMASPPVHAPVETPTWLWVLTSLGVVVSGGALGFVIVKGRKR